MASAPHQLGDGGGVGQVAGHDFLAGGGGRHGRDVGNPQHVGAGLQARSQYPAQVAGGAGQQ